MQVILFAFNNHTGLFGFRWNHLKHHSFSRQVGTIPKVIISGLRTLDENQSEPATCSSGSNTKHHSSNKKLVQALSRNTGFISRPVGSLLYSSSSSEPSELLGMGLCQVIAKGENET